MLARFPDGTLAVKRAAEQRETRTGEPGWWLLSDNPDEGVDSRHRGVVAADDVVAVVRRPDLAEPRRGTAPVTAASLSTDGGTCRSRVPAVPQ